MTATAQDNQIIAVERTQRQSKIQNPKPKIQKGFTLIELLVVIALLAVLLTLIFKPLIDTFNLTSRAGTQVEAQAAARDSLREVTTTLSDAAFVYDNTSNNINIWIPTFGGAPANQTPVPTAHAMVEYSLPSKQYDQSPTLNTDPTTGDPIYSASDSAAKKGYALPLTAGRTLGRLFVGLIDNKPATDTSGANTNGMPATPYFNTYEEPRVNSKDNRYTLYRAEAQTFIADPNGGANPNYIPNLKLFHTVNDSGAIVDTATGTIQLHDPNFFYDSSPAGGKETGAGTAAWAIPGAVPTGNNGTVYTIADNWKAVSSTILLPRKVDAITLNRDPDTNAPLYYTGAGVLDATPQPGDVTRVRPLITFSPYYVENDPGTPASIENSGNEATAPAAISFQTQYAHWNNPFRVQVFRAPDATGDALGQSPLTYYEYDPNTGNIMLNGNAATLVGPNVDPLTGVWLNTPQELNNANFFAYSVDPLGGSVNFSFPWSVVCHDAASNAPLPQTYSPYEINYKLINAPTAGYGKRYLQLGAISTEKWGAAMAQLMPATAQSPLSPTIFGNVPGTLPRISIVAGSEQVFGPDQIPGPHYGYRTQYTRVSASGDAPGLNQYKINYTDVPNAAPAIANDANEPRVGMGYIEFDSINDTSDGSPNIDPFPGIVPVVENTVPPVLAGDPPLVYRPHSLPQLKNQGGVNVPSDPIEVTYRFQMNRPNDVVKADYLTRDLMNISMNVRYYDPRSSRPQEMNLTGQVKTRNLQR